VEGFVKGDVVVVAFPFSDLSQTKRRPALVVAVLGGDDIILCQITGRSVAGRDAIPLDAQDFATGGIRQASNIRPDHLFTADRGIVLYRVGRLTSENLRGVVTRIMEILER